MANMYTVSLPSDSYDKKANIYINPDVSTKAVIFYLHGGGLLYGMRDDLPSTHIDAFTNAGYPVIALDYPLAPLADIEMILSDITASVDLYLDGGIESFDGKSPYFMFGRSAGAYLAIMSALRIELSALPSGVVSYYGYGFLTDFWYNSPAPFYTALPAVPENIFDSLPSELHAEGPIESHYAAYVYGRQSGKWLSLFFKDREKFFYADYSLRSVYDYPVPLFTAHSSNDPDVPFSEYMSLSERYDPVRFVASANQHDFDSDESSQATASLLERTIAFLDRSLHL
jgi:acetyl esterase/lipase